MGQSPLYVTVEVKEVEDIDKQSSNTHPYP